MERGRTVYKRKYPRTVMILPRLLFVGKDKREVLFTFNVCVYFVHLIRLVSFLTPRLTVNN